MYVLRVRGTYLEITLKAALEKQVAGMIGLIK